MDKIALALLVEVSRIIVRQDRIIKVLVESKLTEASRFKAEAADLKQATRTILDRFPDIQELKELSDLI